MTIHDELSLVETMNYCKSDLKTGKPLIVMDIINDKKRNADSWHMDLFDELGNPVRIQCNFRLGKKNKSGARAILEILR